MKQTGFLISFFFIALCTRAQQATNARYLHRASNALTAVLVHDVFSPPVASRLYLYSHIAAYETIVQVQKESGYASLANSIQNFPVLAPPAASVNVELASTAAFYYTADKFVFSESAWRDSFAIALKTFKTLAVKNKDLYQNSLQYGRSVADSIIAWSNGDHYTTTRKIKRYSFSKQAGKWIPTPPAYIAAIEPYWFQMRPVAIDSAAQFALPVHNDFSADTTSNFFKKAYEVYQTGNSLTPEQRLIANYWDCNPFNVNTSGHLLFATKKLSPGGHWMNITKLCCEQTGAGLAKSAAAYVLTAIAIYDGFIGCWYVKYRDNLIRPETFINTHIDAQWKPLLQTPPFPEYPSGHSVISTAAAVVLNAVFGDGFSFTDNTEVIYGLPVRRFASFMKAANEAAISRLYGGIHYRDAVADGQVLGKQTGVWVLQKVRLSDTTVHRVAVNRN